MEEALEKIPEITPALAEKAAESLRQKIEHILSVDLNLPLETHLWKLIRALDYEEEKAQYDFKDKRWRYSVPLPRGEIQLGFHRLLAEIRGLVKAKDNGNGQVRPLVFINLKIGNGGKNSP